MTDEDLSKEVQDAARALNHAICRAEAEGLVVDVNVLEIQSVKTVNGNKVINVSVLRPL